MVRIKRFRFFPAQIDVKIQGAWKNILPILSGIIRDDCNEYCKMDTGNLIMSSLIHSKLDKGRIIWRTPYAKRQYWEIRTAYKDENPKATWRWCEAAKAEYQDRWKEQAQRLIDRQL